MSQFLRADGQVPAMASCLVRSGPQTQRPSTSVFRRPGHEGRMPLPPRPSSARPDEGMRIAGQKQCGQVLTGWEMSREDSGLFDPLDSPRETEDQELKEIIACARIEGIGCAGGDASPPLSARTARSDVNIPRLQTLPLAVSVHQNGLGPKHVASGVAAQRSSSEFDGSSRTSEYPTPGHTPRTDYLSPRRIRPEDLADAADKNLAARVTVQPGERVERNEHHQDVVVPGYVSILDTDSMIAEKENLPLSGDGKIAQGEAGGNVLLQSLNEMQIFSQQVQEDVALVEERGEESLYKLLPRTNSWAEESCESASPSTGGLDEQGCTIIGKPQDGQKILETDRMQIYISSKNAEKNSGEVEIAHRPDLGGVTDAGIGARTKGSSGFLIAKTVAKSAGMRPLSAQDSFNRRQGKPSGTAWLGVKETTSTKMYIQAHNPFTHTVLPREGSHRDQSSRLSGIVGTSITPSTWEGMPVCEADVVGVATGQANTARCRPLSAREGRQSLIAPRSPQEQASRRRPFTARQAPRKMCPEDALHLDCAPLPSYERYTMERERDEFLRTHLEEVPRGSPVKAAEDKHPQIRQSLGRHVETLDGRVNPTLQIRASKHGGKGYFLGNRGVVQTKSECSNLARKALTSGDWHSSLLRKSQRPEWRRPPVRVGFYTIRQRTDVLMQNMEMARDLEAQLNRTLDTKLEQCYHVQQVELVPDSRSKGPADQQDLHEVLDNPASWYKSSGPGSTRDMFVRSEEAAIRPSTALRNTQKQIDDVRAAVSRM